MSKNVYRVSKKSDLDEIMKNNFFKPICIVFLHKSKHSQLYTEISQAMSIISKTNTYNMSLLIDFDNFIDNINFFAPIKQQNVPYYMVFFKGTLINEMSWATDVFVTSVMENMNKIHTNYVNTLKHSFEPNNVTHIPTNEHDNTENSKVDERNVSKIDVSKVNVVDNVSAKMDDVISRASNKSASSRSPSPSRSSSHSSSSRSCSRSVSSSCSSSRSSSSTLSTQAEDIRKRKEEYLRIKREKAEKLRNEL